MHWSRTRWKLTARSALGAALSLVSITVAYAQVEWFTTPYSGESGYPWVSHLGTSGKASGQSSRSPCTFAAVNAPTPSPAWIVQFNPCTPVTLTSGQPGQFDGDSPGEAKGIDTARQESRLTSHATQRAGFHPTYLRVVASVETKHAGGHATNRAMPRAWGQVFFRVPEGPNVKLSVYGTMTWEGLATARNGRLQFSWIPNTIKEPKANRIHFAFTTVDEAASKAVVAKHDIYLSPGVYSVEWVVSNDRSAAEPAPDSRVTLDLSVFFGEEEECADAFTTTVPRWPQGTNYVVTFREQPTSITRNTPHCEKAPRVCWKQRQVRFWLEDRNGGRQSGPHIGWRYEPGTLRRDPYYPRPCRDLDPRFNCHGYQFAEARLWLERAAVDQILEYWCQPVPSSGNLRDGDVRIFSSLKFDYTTIYYFEPDHSQILQQGLTLVDDKLGVLRYDPAFSKNPGWTGGGVPKHYRCRF